jgi:hypothetical protein
MFPNHLAETRNLSLFKNVQNGSAAHPTSYSVGTLNLFPSGKAAEA